MLKLSDFYKLYTQCVNDLITQGILTKEEFEQNYCSVETDLSNNLSLSLLVTGFLPFRVYKNERRTFLDFLFTDKIGLALLKNQDIAAHIPSAYFFMPFFCQDQMKLVYPYELLLGSADAEYYRQNLPYSLSIVDAVNSIGFIKEVISSPDRVQLLVLAPELLICISADKLNQRLEKASLADILLGSNVGRLAFKTCPTLVDKLNSANLTKYTNSIADKKSADENLTIDDFLADFEYARKEKIVDQKGTHPVIGPEGKHLDNFFAAIDHVKHLLSLDDLFVFINFYKKDVMSDDMMAIMNINEIGKWFICQTMFLFKYPQYAKFIKYEHWFQNYPTSILKLLKNADNSFLSHFDFLIEKCSASNAPLLLNLINQIDNPYFVRKLINQGDWISSIESYILRQQLILGKPLLLWLLNDAEGRAVINKHPSLIDNIPPQVFEEILKNCPDLFYTFSGREFVLRHNLDRFFPRHYRFYFEEFLKTVTLHPQIQTDEELKPILDNTLKVFSRFAPRVVWQKDQQIAAVPASTPVSNGLSNNNSSAAPKTNPNLQKLKTILSIILKDKLTYTYKENGEFCFVGPKNWILVLTDYFLNKPSVKIQKKLEKNVADGELIVSGNIDDLLKIIDESREKIIRRLNPKVTKSQELSQLIRPHLRSLNLKFELSNETDARLSISKQNNEETGDTKKTVVVRGSKENIYHFSQQIRKMLNANLHCVGPNAIKGTEDKFEFSSTLNNLINLFKNEKFIRSLTAANEHKSSSSLSLLSISSPVILATDEEKINWVKALSPAFCHANNISSMVSFWIVKDNDQEYTKITISLPASGLELTGVRNPEQNVKNHNSQLTVANFTTIAKKIKSYYTKHNPNEASCSFNKKENTLSIVPRCVNPQVLNKVFHEISSIFQTYPAFEIVEPSQVKDTDIPSQYEKTEKPSSPSNSFTDFPSLPTNEAIRKILISCISDYTQCSFDFLNTIQSKNKAKTKWEITFSPQGVLNGLGSSHISVLEIFEMISNALNALVKKLQEDNLLKPVAGMELMRIPVKSNKVHVIINLDACKLELIEENMDFVRAHFNHAIKLRNDTKTEEEFAINPIPLAPVVQAPIAAKNSPPKKEIDDGAYTEQVIKQAIDNIARQRNSKFENIEHYLNVLKNINAPKTNDMDSDALVNFYAFEVNIIRLCETLATSKNSIFTDLRNHVRHLRNRPWKDFYDATKPMIEAISQYVTMKIKKSSYKITLYNFIPNELSACKTALKTIKETIQKYNADYAKQIQEAKPERLTDEEYVKQLTSIGENTSMSGDLIRTAIVGVNSRRGELKANKRKALAKIYAAVGHHDLDVPYADFEKQLIERYSYYFQDYPQEQKKSFTTAGIQ